MSETDNVIKMARPRAPDNRHQLETLDPCGALNGIQAGQWTELADEYGLPPDCPVTPLGFDDDAFYFVNARGTLAVLTPNNSGRGHLEALFSPYRHYPSWAWPKKGRDKKPSGQFHADDMRADLFAAASKAGGWNAVEKVRGRGAWLGADGGLVLHLGRKIIVNDEALSPGAVDGFLYPVRPPMAGPDNIEMNAAHDLLQIFSTWSWARPKLDPELVLGWLVAAMLGGALERRPIIYVTGDKGTGKTTLQDVCAYVIGKGLVKTSDATRAGIDQSIKSDSIPVMVDEMEAKADPRRAQNILELSRTAYDGSLTLRGGADHNGREFRARSCFWFSSINPPAMEPQDRSRMAVLEMMKLPENSKSPNYETGVLSAIGQTLLYRAYQWWPRFAELLELFREALMKGGHDQRGATTWGILAACAYLARFDDMPDEAVLGQWALLLNPKGLAEFEAISPDWKSCVDYMMTTSPRLFDRKGWEVRTIGGAIAQWVDEFEVDHLTNLKIQLQLVGVTLLFPKGEPHVFQHAELLVPNSHPGLKELFSGTHWGNMAGGSAVWTSALRKMPRDYWRSGSARINHMKMRGTLIKLSKIMELGDE
jgi:hypothetical protein